MADCGKATTQGRRADGTANNANMGDAAKEKLAETQASENAYYAALSWLDDQTCPRSGEDGDCTTIHATIAVQQPSVATWTGTPGQPGAYNSICAWTATVECAKKLEKPHVKPGKHRIPENPTNVLPRSVELKCAEEFYEEGSSLGSAQEIGCDKAQTEALKKARLQALKDAGRRANIARCSPDCPVRVCEIWVAAPLKDGDPVPGDPKCKATAKCEYVVQATCQKKD